MLIGFLAIACASPSRPAPVTAPPIANPTEASSPQPTTQVDWGRLRGDEVSYEELMRLFQLEGDPWQPDPHQEPLGTITLLSDEQFAELPRLKIHRNKYPWGSVPEREIPKEPTPAEVAGTRSVDELRAAADQAGLFSHERPLLLGAIYYRDPSLGRALVLENLRAREGQDKKRLGRQSSALSTLRLLPGKEMDDELARASFCALARFPDEWFSYGYVINALMKMGREDVLQRAAEVLRDGQLVTTLAHYYWLYHRSVEDLERDMRAFGLWVTPLTEKQRAYVAHQTHWPPLDRYQDVRKILADVPVSWDTDYHDFSYLWGILYQQLPGVFEGVSFGQYTDRSARKTHALVASYQDQHYTLRTRAVPGEIDNVSALALLNHVLDKKGVTGRLVFVRAKGSDRMGVLFGEPGRLRRFFALYRMGQASFNLTTRVSGREQPAACTSP